MSSGAPFSVSLYYQKCNYSLLLNNVANGLDSATPFYQMFLVAGCPAYR